jgi:hypothetical protein
MGIFDIDAESIDFPDRFNCDLCYERIDIMYIDRKGALDGQMVFRCHPCRMRMKKTTSNSLNDAHVGPTIGMRHPLQPLAFKDFSMQDPNDGHAHVPYNGGSFFHHNGMYELFGCNDKGTKQVFNNNRDYHRSCANEAASKFGSESDLTLPPGLQWPLQPLACRTYDSTVSRSSAMATSHQPSAREHDCDHLSSSAQLTRQPSQEYQTDDEWRRSTSGQTLRDALAFERQTGYCRTPNSIDHQHRPYHMIVGERLARCQHCVRFLPKEPNWKYYDSDGSPKTAVSP